MPPPEASIVLPADLQKIKRELIKAHESQKSFLNSQLPHHLKREHVDTIDTENAIALAHCEVLRHGCRSFERAPDDSEGASSSSSGGRVVVGGCDLRTSMEHVELLQKDLQKQRIPTPAGTTSTTTATSNSSSAGSSSSSSSSITTATTLANTTPPHSLAPGHVLGYYAPDAVVSRDSHRQGCITSINVDLRSVTMSTGDILEWTHQVFVRYPYELRASQAIKEFQMKQTDEVIPGNATQSIMEQLYTRCTTELRAESGVLGAMVSTPTKGAKNSTDNMLRRSPRLQKANMQAAEGNEAKQKATAQVQRRLMSQMVAARVHMKGTAPSPSVFAAEEEIERYVAEGDKQAEQFGGVEHLTQGRAAAVASRIANHNDAQHLEPARSSEQRQAGSNANAPTSRRLFYPRKSKAPL